MDGINYDPLQSHDEAASGNETYSPVVMEFTSAVTGANGCETLYEIRTRKLDTLCLPSLSSAPDCCNSWDEKYLRAFVFLRKSIASLWCIKWRARMRKSKSRSFNPSSPLFLERQMAGKEWTPRTSKYFDSIRILIWHMGAQASPAMPGKASTLSRSNAHKAEYSISWHLLFMKEVLNGSTTSSSDCKEDEKVKTFFSEEKVRVFGSRIEIGERNLSKGN